MARADTYALTGEFVAAEFPGVLSNDDEPTRALEAFLVSGPQHGTLEFRENGAFVYRPGPDFPGQDTFTYRAISAPPLVSFAIDPSESTGVVDVEVETAFGDDDDDAASRIGGQIQARLTRVDGKLSTLHIREMRATLADPMHMDFCLLRLLDCVAGLELQTGAGDLGIEMTDPGPTTSLDATGAFDQGENRFDLEGNVTVRGTGQAAGLIPAGQTPLDGVGIEVGLTGNIVESADKLTLAFPIEVRSDTSVADTLTATIVLVGNIVASAPASAFVPPEISDPVVVTIQATATDSDGDGMSDAWEIAHGLSVGVDDGAQDRDGDGQSNLAEFESGTDPTKALDVFRATGLQRTAGAITITFQAVEGRRYAVQESPDLVTWETLLDAEISATAREAVYAGQLIGEAPRQVFYRFFPLNNEAGP